MRVRIEGNKYQEQLSPLIKKSDVYPVILLSGI